MLKISLVVPTFNAADYLSRFFDSVLAQKYPDFELIVVDDGSTDATREICDEYAKRDSRICVIHKTNEGCSAARQSGMQYVHGDYVLHIDSDDWLEPDCLVQFVSKADETNADIIWCDSYCNESSLWRFESDETPDALIHSIMGQKMWGVLWNKMVRTSIAKEWGIVPKNISMWEDMAYIVPCLLHCQSVSYISKPLYHYNIGNQDSMVHKQQSQNMAIQYCSAIDHIEHHLSMSKKIADFQQELYGLQLFAIRDYIDDIRFRDYEKFLTTYPDAIEHIGEYESYPNRLKICAFLIQKKCEWIIPIILKVDGIFRKLGFSKQV